MTESFQIFSWWLLLFVFGLFGIPSTWFFFKRFADIGYGLSKITGLIIVSYIAFLLSILHILPLKTPVLYFYVVIFLSINILIFFKNKGQIIPTFKQKFWIIAFQEILFTTGFLFWTWVRAHQPDINGLEKFMDFGFINSILRSDFLPPQDMWFAGKSINYYWFGHFMTALLTKLTNIPSSITYNLMLATILGLTLTSAFSIVSTLLASLNSSLNNRTIFVGGLISAILLAFAGNFHTPFYALKQGVDKYWYPDATRFIGYNPDTNDKTIHEFPIYSFVVSDLHPHLLNLPLVFLYIASLFSYLALRNNEAPNTKQYLNSNISNSKLLGKLRFKALNLSRISDLGFRVLPLGFLLGIFFMTNTWDFVNYLVLTGVAAFLLNLKAKKLFDAVFSTASLLVSVIVLGLVVASSFLLNFESIAQGVGFVHARTPLWQLGILWGFTAILTTVFILACYKLKNEVKASDLFVLSLLMASWILIILPEIIFVKDIYIASYHRANTMFKLTYQAFVMSYLSSGYVSVRLLALFNKLPLKILAALSFALIFASILWYPKLAIDSYYQGLKNYKGLSGDTWLTQRHPDIYKAILWFRKNVDGQPTILEAPGDSYTEFNVISSYTGLPTVSGWFVHEWLWRGSAEIPQKRVTDIQQIYTSENIEITKSLLKKYNVEYIIVGSFERQKFPNLNAEKISQIGKEVFTSPTTKIYKI